MNMIKFVSFDFREFFHENYPILKKVSYKLLLLTKFLIRKKFCKLIYVFKDLIYEFLKILYFYA